MTPFRREQPHASTTPVADRMLRPTFLQSFVKVSLVAGISYAAVAIYGLPALKFDYVYRGRHESRIELSCRYLTFDGLQRYVPGLREERCPVIKFFPAGLPAPF